MSGESWASTIFRRDGEPKAGPGGVLTRAVAFLIWQLADPRSLPVPPLAADGERSAGSGKGVRVAAAVVWILVAATTASSFVAVQSIRSRAREALLGVENDPGTPIEEVAQHLENAAAGLGWLKLYPGLEDRLLSLAEAVRAGREPLVEAAAAYDSVRAALEGLDVPGRLLRGGSVAAPAIEAMDEIPTSWHRGTLAFGEMQIALAPYADAAARARPVTRLTGRVIGAPPGYGLAIAVLRPDGTTLEAMNRILKVGDDFDIPFARETLIELSAVRSTDGTMVESVRTPVETWRSTFDLGTTSGRYEIRFAPELVQRAPELPPLSMAAKREIGYLVPDGDDPR